MTRGKSQEQSISYLELQKYEQEGIINFDEMRKQYKEMKHKNIISNHEEKHKIWKGKDGEYYTYIDDESKKSKRALKHRATRKKLDDYLIDYYMSKEGVNDLVNPTIFELYKLWIKYKESRTNASSYIKKLSADWKRFYLCYPEIYKPINSFDPISIEIFINNILKDFKPTDKAAYNMVHIIYGIFEYAYIRKIISENPLKDYKLPKNLLKKAPEKVDSKEVYFEKEQALMEDHCYYMFGKNNKIISPLSIPFCFQTGLRIGELSAIKFSDVVDNKIYIKRQEVQKFKLLEDRTTKYDGVEVVEHAKTDEGEREVYLSSEALKILDMIKMSHLKYGYEDEDYIFLTRKGTRINKTSIDSLVTRYCEKLFGANIKRMHKIRKTFISILFDSRKISDEKIQKMSGHKDIKTSHMSYHFNRKDDNENYEAFEKCITRSGRKTS